MTDFYPKSLEETQQIAESFIKNISPQATATVVGLYGGLGAGKTSFTQGVAKALGVTENITSPTFVIQKVYELENQSFKHLIHIDAYRLEKEEELLHLGWKEILKDSENLILIEWPEKVSGIMPSHIQVKLSHESPESRKIEIVEGVV